MSNSILENGTIVYNKIKELYIENYGRKGFFYQDYFKDEKIGTECFISDLIKHEPQLNLCEIPTEDDIEIVWENIQEGIFSSKMIMHQVDRLTDKYNTDF